MEESDWEDPAAAAELLRGSGVPWWVGGGWALEKFAAVRRPQSDIDIGVFAEDLPLLRAWLPPDHEVVEESADRLVVRTPWTLDVHVNRGSDGEWVFPLDPAVTMPLDDATWTSGGIRYLRPEFVLLFKAEEKDGALLEAVLPWLPADARGRLAKMLTKLNRDHPWLDRL